MLLQQLLLVFHLLSSDVNAVASVGVVAATAVRVAALLLSL